MEQIFKKLMAFVVLFLLLSCATSKKHIQKEISHKKDSVYQSIENTTLKQVNKSIDDSIFISLSTGDFHTDSIITKRLKYFKTIKKSGDNHYEISYDNDSKGLQIMSKIGTTENSTKTRSNQEFKDFQSSQKNEKIKENRNGFSLWSTLFFILIIVVIIVVLIHQYRNL